LVRRTRELVGQKDTVTKIIIERDADLQRVRQERKAQLEDACRKREARQAAKAKIFSVFGEPDPWKRGHLLESALNDLFKAHGMLIRESFVLRTDDGQIREQIDGAIEIQSHLYLVEVRYRDSPTGAEEIARHLSRVQYRSGARGLFISVSALTEPAVISFREAHQEKVHLAMIFSELVPILDEDHSLSVYLHRRALNTILEKNPFAKSVHV
jgi:restriction system protein